MGAVEADLINYISISCSRAEADLRNAVQTSKLQIAGCWNDGVLYWWQIWLIAPIMGRSWFYCTILCHIIPPGSLKHNWLQISHQRWNEISGGVLYQLQSRKLYFENNWALSTWFNLRGFVVLEKTGNRICPFSLESEISRRRGV